MFVKLFFAYLFLLISIPLPFLLPLSIFIIVRLTMKLRAQVQAAHAAHRAVAQIKGERAYVAALRYQAGEYR